MDVGRYMTDSRIYGITEISTESKRYKNKVRQDMSEKNDKELYLNFDEYIRQGDPQKKERAEAWRVAIGLQAVDGLKVSDYLLELARRNIEGEISMEEVELLLNRYYENKTTREADDDDKQEADKASKNIKRILSVKTCDRNEARW